MVEPPEDATVGRIEETPAQKGVDPSSVVQPWAPDWDMELDFEPDLADVDLAELQRPLPEAVSSPLDVPSNSGEASPTDVSSPSITVKTTDDAPSAMPAAPAVTPEGAVQLLQWLSDLAPPSPEQPTPLPLAPVREQSPEPPLPPPQTSGDRTWYLSLDIGTTGISAVLLHRPSRALYPLYWLAIQPAPSNEWVALPTVKTFRLPLAIKLTEEPQDTGIVPEFGMPASVPRTMPSVLAIAQATQRFQGFKPWLKVGIPYLDPQTQRDEPVVQWSDHQAIALSTFLRGLQALLATLTQVAVAGAVGTAERAVQSQPVLTCGAVGLEDSTLQTALQQLAGVIVGYPANWPDTYPLNVRTAILKARLVSRPEQIFFLEDAIALALAQLPASDGQPVMLPPGLARPTHPHEFGRGTTLIVSAGAIASELALVNLPGTLQVLTYQDFDLRSLPYGGDAIDQDIIIRLIYPAWLRQSQAAANRFALPDWQIPLPLGRDPWEALQWDTLSLPPAGEPDLQRRQAFHRRLLSSPVGLLLLEAARRLKVALQQQEQFTLQVGDRLLLLTRQDLSSSVLLAYVQRLNRELNALLHQKNLMPVEVNQVVCSGGSASFGAIARWLRQKLPNAIIIQDTYVQAGMFQDTAPHTWSRVAYGLATLPLHPAVLDQARQQYSDYFLLMELLRSCPDAPFTLNSLMPVLSRRGIAAEVCQGHIFALLEGHLPPGLVPTDRDRDLLAPVSQNNPTYAQLLAAPLFHKEDNQTYRLNPEQKAAFLRYLSTLLATTGQSLAEPLPLEI